MVTEMETMVAATVVSEVATKKAAAKPKTQGKGKAAKMVEEPNEEKEARLKELVGSLKEAQIKIQSVGRQTLENILKAGELLVHMKELNVRSYRKLVEATAEETGIKWRSACNYVRVYKAKQSGKVLFEKDWTIADAYQAVGVTKQKPAPEETEEKKPKPTHEREDKQTKTILELVQPSNAKVIERDRKSVYDMLEELLTNLDTTMEMIGENGLLLKFAA